MAATLALWKAETVRPMFTSSACSRVSSCVRLHARAYDAVWAAEGGERGPLGLRGVGAEGAAALASRVAVECVEEAVVAVLGEGGWMRRENVIVGYFIMGLYITVG